MVEQLQNVHGPSEREGGPRYCGEGKEVDEMEASKRAACVPRASLPWTVCTPRLRSPVLLAPAHYIKYWVSMNYERDTYTRARTSS